MRAGRIACATRASLIAASVMIAALASAAVAQQPLTILGLQIPERVGGLGHAAPHDFEKTNPGLGYSIQFVRPGWSIDVYIYDMRMKSIPDDPDSEVIRKQSEQATSEIFELEKRGVYSSVAAKGDYAIDRDGRTRFVCSTFTYVHNRSAVTVDSYLCLTGWKNKFFKIRMTTVQGDDSRGEADKFVHAWIAVLWPS